MHERLLYSTVNLFTRVLPCRICYAAAGQAAGWAYRHNDAARNGLAANLRVVLDGRAAPWSQSELEQLVRSNFVNFAKYVVDFFQSGHLSSEALDARITVEGMEYLQACLAMEKGVIGVTAHIGNWELGAHVLGATGSEVNAVVRAQSSARLDALFQSQRMRRGVHPLSMDHAAASASACLRRNGLVVLLADLDFANGRRGAALFGKPARLPRGPAVLAKRSGAPILPAFVLRRPDDTFLFRASPPILPAHARSVDEIQDAICAELEAVIADHPDQWFAFEPLWR